jgi:hypothetical protein
VGEKATQAWDTVTHPGTWLADKAPVRLDHATHPDHPMYQQARSAVHQIDASQRRTPDQHSDNLAAALTVAARQGGMTRIDKATLSDDGSRAFAIQGDARSPLKQIAEVHTQRAVNTPIEQSSAALATIGAPTPAPAPAPPTRDRQPPLQHGS